MENTPDKTNISTVSNNSLNNSQSLTKEKEIIKEKENSSHKHVHNKEKCAICMAKEKKNPKKKTVFEEKKIQSSKNFHQKPEKIPEEDEIHANMPEKPNLVMKTMRHPSLTFIFDADRDEYPNRPYHMDGDPKMYTPEMINIRENLRSDFIVKKSINNFMVLYQLDNQNLLSKKGYIDINYKIVRILRPELKGQEMLDDMKFTLEQDWKHDAKNKDKMTKEDLFDSLFELADIWTGGVDNQEYGSFLDMLKMKIILDEQKNPNEVPYDILY